MSNTNSFESAIASANVEMNGKVAVGMSGKLAHRMRGYTRGMLVSTKCGRTINAISMSLADAVASGHEICGLCDGRNKKAEAPKPVVEIRKCADCGEKNTSSTSEYCSVCRPYHPHTFVKMSKAIREQCESICEANGREFNPNTCGLCGVAHS
jgi:hypothetical protein